MTSYNIALILIALILFSFSWFKNDHGKNSLAREARWSSTAFLSLALGELYSVSISAQFEISLIGAISMGLIGIEITLALLGGIIYLIPPAEFQTPPRIYWIALRYIGIATCILLLIWATQILRISLWVLLTPLTFFALLLLAKWLSKNSKKAN